MLYDLFYNPIGSAVLLFIPLALIGALRAQKRAGTGWGKLFYAVSFELITSVILTLVLFVVLMVMWGMSV